MSGMLRIGMITLLAQTMLSGCGGIEQGGEEGTPQVGTDEQALLDWDSIPKRLEPEPEGHCICETRYCTCMSDCITPYFFCKLASVGIDVGQCFGLKALCEAQCKASHEPVVRYTCYPLEPDLEPGQCYEAKDCPRGHRCTNQRCVPELKKCVRTSDCGPSEICTRQGVCVAY